METPLPKTVAFRDTVPVGSSAAVDGLIAEGLAAMKTRSAARPTWC